MSLAVEDRWSTGCGSVWVLNMKMSDQVKIEFLRLLFDCFERLGVIRYRPMHDSWSPPKTKADGQRLQERLKALEKEVPAPPPDRRVIN
jgi:hypothetical protein